MITAKRYHDISCGHRVHNHESKCALMHGHNYRIHFTATPKIELDTLGRVIDFSVLKATLCVWLESHWDHKFLAWEQDPIMQELPLTGPGRLMRDSIVWVPFNPTAENMASHLLLIIGPRLLDGHGVRLTQVVVEETRKCSAEAQL